MCMWDNKGTLVPCYALLMDNSIVLTENPPKNIVHNVPLSGIKDISLVRRVFCFIFLFACMHFSYSL